MSVIALLLRLPLAGLLDLADSYCESQLRRRCERLLRLRVSYGNVATLMAVAIKYKAEVRESLLGLRDAVCSWTGISTLIDAMEPTLFSTLAIVQFKPFINVMVAGGST